MKGAKTEPFADINNKPNNSITKIIGANQNFFLKLRKLHNSFKSDILNSYQN